MTFSMFGSYSRSVPLVRRNVVGFLYPLVVEPYCAIKTPGASWFNLTIPVVLISARAEEADARRSFPASRNRHKGIFLRALVRLEIVVVMPIQSSACMAGDRVTGCTNISELFGRFAFPSAVTFFANHSTAEKPKTQNSRIL
jgi:hypothetical protein